jgi:type IV pilus assembly protein PilC
MKFKYDGVTRDRQRVQGVVDAQDLAEANIRLRSMQIRADSVTAVREYGQFLNKFVKSSPINLKGLIIFTRQFSSLIDSGIGIIQCLEILTEQESRKGFKKVLLQVREDLESGSGLAEALGKHANVFSQFFIRVVEAGELSGTLDKSLKRVCVQLEKMGRLKAKVIGAVTYPAITILVALVAILVLLLKVLPEVAKLYGSRPLPPITVMVLDISKFVQNNYFFIMVVIGGAGFGMSSLLKYPPFRKVFDPILIKIPIAGTLALRSGVAQFTRTLGTLVASGVPLLTAFEICEKLTTNYAIANSIRKASTAVSEGRGIAVGLGETKVFPSMVIHMVNTGEVTGRLDEMLAKIADIYDEEVDDAVAAFTDILQPILLVVVGGIIMVLMMAMYAPIMGMSEAASGM